MTTAFDVARRRQATRKVSKNLKKRFVTKELTHHSAGFGDRSLYIGGRVFNSTTIDVATVKNTGRPAAAFYSAGEGSTTIVSAGGRSAFNNPPIAEPPRQYATFVIAASDSTADGKANANYVCDGTDDQDTINLALTETTPSGFRRVLLLEGTFTITGGMTLPANSVIEGQGANTVVKIASSGAASTLTVFTLDDQCKVANLKIDGNGVANTKIAIYADTKTGVEVTGVLVSDLNTYGIALDACVGARIVGNRAIDCGVMGIRARGGSSNTIIGNTCYGNQFGIYLGYTGSEEMHTTVAGNTCKRNTYDIYLANAYYNVVTGNTCAGIVGDLGDYGIFLDSGNYNVISDNEVAAHSGGGIFVSFADHNVIADNYIIGNSWSTSTSTGVNVTCGIELDESDSNFIHGNKIIKSLDGASEIQQYSIRLDSTACNDNVIIDNDLRNSGHTGFSNLGAGTIYRPHDGSTPMRTLTIASGVVTVPGEGYYSLLPQTGTADDLDTILGGKDGMVIYIRNDNVTNTITSRHGTGNLDLQGYDKLLNSESDVQSLIYNAESSKWIGLSTAVDTYFNTPVSSISFEVTLNDVDQGNGFTDRENGTDGWFNDGSHTPTFLSTSYIPGYWSIGNRNDDRLWSFWKQPGYDFETLTSGNIHTVIFGPIMMSDNLCPVDTDCYFSIHADIAGPSYDADIFARFHVYWDSGASEMKIRPEYKDGTTQTDGSWITLSSPPLQPLVLAIVIKNDTNKNVKWYMGDRYYHVAVESHMSLIQSVDIGSGVTWGQFATRLHHGRTAGSTEWEYMHIGSVDHEGDFTI